jgi:hypothetical protein
MNQKVAKTARWQRLLPAILSCVLLLPVPAFAFTWATGSDWTIASGTWPGNGTNWGQTGLANVSSTLGVGYGAVTNEPDWLFIQPTATSNSNTSIWLQRDFFIAPGSTLSANALLDNFIPGSGTTGLAAVWVTMGTNNSGTLIGTGTSGNNVSGLPFSGSNQFGQADLFSPGKYTLNVRFELTGGNWSISGTSTRGSQAIFQFTD